MTYPYYGYPLVFGFLDFVGHVIVLAILILTIVLVTQWARSGGRVGRWRNLWSAHTALTILNERYARGEITGEEYAERRKTLTGE